MAPSSSPLVSSFLPDTREISFSSRESIALEAPEPLRLACEELYDKNVRARRAELSDDEDRRASIWIDNEHLSDENRQAALRYGDETVSMNRSAIRMDFRYYATTTSDELAAMALAAAKRFKPQEPTWIESWTPEQMRRMALFADKTADDYVMEKGYYRDHKSGRYYRSFDLYEKANPGDASGDAELRKIPGYSGLSTESKRLVAHQWYLYNRLAELSPDTVTATRHKIGLKLLTPETLVHGTRYDRDKIASIARTGILSPEFRGGHEKGVARYCSEFFRVPRVMSVREYVEYYHTPEAFFTTMHGLVPFYVDRMESELFPKRESDEPFVAFFVDTEHGDLSEYMDREAYRGHYAEMREIAKSLPYHPGSPEAARMSAVLCGIPARYVAGILVSNPLLSSPGEMDFIRNAFDPSTLVFSLDGEIVPGPTLCDDTPEWLR